MEGRRQEQSDTVDSFAFTGREFKAADVAKSKRKWKGLSVGQVCEKKKIKPNLSLVFNLLLGHCQEKSNFMI